MRNLACHMPHLALVLSHAMLQDILAIKTTLVQQQAPPQLLAEHVLELSVLHQPVQDMVRNLVWYMPHQAPVLSLATLLVIAELRATLARQRVRLPVLAELVLRSPVLHQLLQDMVQSPVWHMQLVAVVVLLAAVVLLDLRVTPAPRRVLLPASVELARQLPALHQLAQDMVHSPVWHMPLAQVALVAPQDIAVTKPTLVQQQELQQLLAEHVLRSPVR